MPYTGTQLHYVMFSSGKHSLSRFKFIGKFTKCTWQCYECEKLLFMLQLFSEIPRVYANSCDEL